MATKAPHKQTPAQARKAALESDFAPLYAVAGITDVVADTLRTTLTQAQARAAERLNELTSRPAELEKQARLSAEEIVTFVNSLPSQVMTLPEQVKTLPAVARTQLAGVQKRAEAHLSEATSAYGDLAGRGKRAVDSTFVTAKKTRDQAEAAADDVFADVTDAVDPAFVKAQDAVAEARKTVTGRMATPKQSPKTTPQKPPTKKAPAARKAPAKKTAG